MRSYLTILRLPGALAFCAAGFVARAGGAMMSIGAVLMVSALYGSYGLAGGLAAANGVAWALGTAYLSGLVDRHGQRQVMLPAALVSAASLAAMVVSGLVHAPIWALFVLIVISGATGGSHGALVRARWSYLLKSPALLHTAYSLESTLDELCFVIGPVVATALATTVHPAAGLVCPVVLGAVGALLLYSQRSTQPPVEPVEMGEGGRRKHEKLVLAYPGFVPVVGISLLLGVIFGAIDVTAVAATTAWDQRSKAGIVLAAMSAGSALAGILYGARAWASPLWKRYTILVVALGVSVCSLLFVGRPLTLAVCGFVAGFTIAPTFINSNAIIVRLIPTSRLTEGLAWLGTSMGIGTSIGSTIAGQAIDVQGWRAGFVVAAAAGLASVAIAAGCAKVMRRLTTGPEPTTEPDLSDSALHVDRDVPEDTTNPSDGMGSGGSTPHGSTS
ncbi:MAG: MFS transporter [Propionibacteriaceae bacterium]|jgi:MFS family permease|nr:MFS transporter [Propionibacteriaceae bacterium]